MPGWGFSPSLPEPAGVDPEPEPAGLAVGSPGFLSGGFGPFGPGSPGLVEGSEGFSPSGFLAEGSAPDAEFAPGAPASGLRPVGSVFGLEDASVPALPPVWSPGFEAVSLRSPVSGFAERPSPVFPSAPEGLPASGLVGSFSPGLPGFDEASSGLPEWGWVSLPVPELVPAGPSVDFLPVGSFGFVSEVFEPVPQTAFGDRFASSGVTT